MIGQNEALANAKRKLVRAQQRMKRYYDQQLKEVTFEPRQYVYLKIAPRKQRAMRKRYNFKLSKNYYGPFKILQRIGKVAYRLELSALS